LAPIQREDESSYGMLREGHQKLLNGKY